MDEKKNKPLFSDYYGADCLVCPYCGQAQEYHEPEDISAYCCETECENCGKTIEYSVTVKRVYYPLATEEGDAEPENRRAAEVVVNQYGNNCVNITNLGEINLNL